MRSAVDDIEVVFQAETERAICVRSDEDGEDVWIPKSQCSGYEANPERGDIITITAPQWLLEERGLI